MKTNLSVLALLSIWGCNAQDDRLPYMGNGDFTVDIVKSDDDVCMETSVVKCIQEIVVLRLPGLIEACLDRMHKTNKFSVEGWGECKSASYSGQFRKARVQLLENGELEFSYKYYGFSDALFQDEGDPSVAEGEKDDLSVAEEDNDIEEFCIRFEDFHVSPNHLNVPRTHLSIQQHEKTPEQREKEEKKQEPKQDDKKQEEPPQQATKASTKGSVGPWKPPRYLREEEVTAPQRILGKKKKKKKRKKWPKKEKVTTTSKCNFCNGDSSDERRRLQEPDHQTKYFLHEIGSMLKPLLSEKCFLGLDYKLEEVGFTLTKWDRD